MRDLLWGLAAGLCLLSGVICVCEGISGLGVALTSAPLMAVALAPRGNKSRRRSRGA